jgi:hypothetical protein
MLRVVQCCKLRACSWSGLLQAADKRMAGRRSAQNVRRALHTAGQLVSCSDWALHAYVTSTHTALHHTRQYQDVLKDIQCEMNMHSHISGP